MAAEHEELTPTSYINHHLTFETRGAASFWTLNVDTLIMSAILGVLCFGFLWWVTRNATPGVPSRKQAFVELALDWVDEQVKGIFHGPRDFVTPLAVTTFVW